MAGEVLRVRGYRELLRACQRAERSSKAEVRKALKGVGEVVRADAAEDFSKYSTRSAAGFKVRVRQRGVAVEQSLRKTTGKHPEWGALQMTKALIPARSRDEGRIEQEFERALDRVADIFER
jgi:hypothetical protein